MVEWSSGWMDGEDEEHEYEDGDGEHDDEESTKVSTNDIERQQ